MTQEISDTVKEQDFKKAALSIIKSSHHHDDGSEVVINEVDQNSDIEQKIIEDEQDWKLKMGESKNNAVIESNDKKTLTVKDETEEIVPLPQKKKEFFGSCTCGQLFATTSKSEGEITVKSYDSSGNPAATYSAQSESENYSAGASTNQDYATQ